MSFQAFIVANETKCWYTIQADVIPPRPLSLSVRPSFPGSDRTGLSSCVFVRLSVLHWTRPDRMNHMCTFVFACICCSQQFAFVIVVLSPRVLSRRGMTSSTGNAWAGGTQWQCRDGNQGWDSFNAWDGSDPDDELNVYVDQRVYNIPEDFDDKSWAKSEKQKRYVIELQIGCSKKLWCRLCGKFGDCDTHYKGQEHLKHVIEKTETYRNPHLWKKPVGGQKPGTAAPTAAGGTCNWGATAGAHCNRTNGKVQQTQLPYDTLGSAYGVPLQGQPQLCTESDYIWSQQLWQHSDWPNNNWEQGLQQQMPQNNGWGQQQQMQPDHQQTHGDRPQQQQQQQMQQQKHDPAASAAPAAAAAKEALPQQDRAAATPTYIMQQPPTVGDLPPTEAQPWNTPWTDEDEQRMMPAFIAAQQREPNKSADIVQEQVLQKDFEDKQALARVAALPQDQLQQYGLQYGLCHSSSSSTCSSSTHNTRKLPGAIAGEPQAATAGGMSYGQSDACTGRCDVGTAESLLEVHTAILNLVEIVEGLSDIIHFQSERTTEMQTYLNDENQDLFPADQHQLSKRACFEVKQNTQKVAASSKYIVSELQSLMFPVAVGSPPANGTQQMLAATSPGYGPTTPAPYDSGTPECGMPRAYAPEADSAMSRPFAPEADPPMSRPLGNGSGRLPSGGAVAS